MTATQTFPPVRTCPYTPPAEYRDLPPISRVPLPNGMTVWAVTRHQDVRAVLTDPRFSSDRYHPGFPRFTELPTGSRFDTSLIGLDPPEHGPARRAVLGEFTVKRLEALRPRVQEIVDQHVDALLAGPRPADLVTALSLPVPSLVICELLGVPYADHDFFQTRSSTLLRLDSTPEQKATASAELRGYLSDLIDAKAADPGDDLISRQLARDPVPERQALIALATLLLIAGHETTANMISLGAVAMLAHPDQLAALRADPGRTPHAVEELLRVFTIAEFATSRVAVADVELGGVLIRAGEGVLTVGNAANHDPDVFPDPDRVDTTRGARNHLAFGYGAHQCLGQNLARIELQVVFDTLFARVPSLRLAVGQDELPYKDEASIYGVHRLPVTW
jgi:cytochrome P450